MTATYTKLTVAHTDLLRVAKRILAAIDCGCATESQSPVTISDLRTAIAASEKIAKEPRHG